MSFRVKIIDEPPPRFHKVKLVVVASLVVAGLLGLCWVWIHRYPKDEDGNPLPPFRGAQFAAGGNPRILLEVYDEEEAEADKYFKGKVRRLHDMGRMPWAEHIKVDNDGRKYVSYPRWANNPRDEKEAIRCYLFRPHNPIVEGSGVRREYTDWGIVGFCKGKKDGVVILVNCTIYVYSSGGPDW